MSLPELANMATLQLFILGGSGGMLLQEILVILGVLRVLRCILRHTEKHTELLEKRLIIIAWSIIYAYTIVLVCMHKSKHACTTHARIAYWSCDSTHY